MACSRKGERFQYGEGAEAAVGDEHGVQVLGLGLVVLECRWA